MLNFDGEFWKEIRCPRCRRLIGYEYIWVGRTMHKCPRCGEIVVIRYKTPLSLLKKLWKSGQLDANPENEIVLNPKSPRSKSSPQHSGSAEMGEGIKKDA